MNLLMIVLLIILIPVGILILNILLTFFKTEESYQRGRIIQTEPNVVSCLWENWEIYDAVLDKRFHVSRESPRLWKAHYGLVRGNLELLNCYKGWTSGHFCYEGTVYVFNEPNNFIINLRYHTASEGYTAVEGMFHVKATGISALAMRLFRRTQHLICDLVIQGGVDSCTMISHRRSEALEKLSPEQIEILESYLNGEAMDETRIKPIESTLEIHPLDGASRVWLRTIAPIQRTIEMNIEAGGCPVNVSETFESLILLASNFAARSRRDVKIDASDAPLPKDGARFYTEVKKIGREIYQTYIKDNVNAYLTTILHQPQPTRLYIDAHGRDAALPWEIMHNGEDFLSLLVGMARAGAPITKQYRRFSLRNLLIVASDTHADLPEIENELNLIVKAVEGLHILSLKPLMGEGATKKAVLKEIALGKYDVLHYCGHSVYDAKNPEMSYLLLHGNEQLTARDLAHYCGSGNSLQMVCLNSCFSGVTAPSGVEISGLSHAFVRAGIPYVIGIRYKISDRAAKVLAENFYPTLLECQDPVEALRQTRIAVGVEFNWEDPGWASPTIYV